MHDMSAPHFRGRESVVAHGSERHGFQRRSPWLASLPRLRPDARQAVERPPLCLLDEGRVRHPSGHYCLAVVPERCDDGAQRRVVKDHGQVDRISQGGEVPMPSQAFCSHLSDRLERLGSQRAASCTLHQQPQCTQAVVDRAIPRDKGDQRGSQRQACARANHDCDVSRASVAQSPACRVPKPSEKLDALLGPSTWVKRGETYAEGRSSTSSPEPAKHRRYPIPRHSRETRVTLKAQPF